MRDERWEKLMKGIEKRHEKTKSSKEASDVLAFKCFLLQSRIFPHPQPYLL
jgi:hypothetical protein